MNYNNANSDISQYLKKLGLQKCDELPTIKDLRKAFFSSARINHPDKNSKLDPITRSKKEEMFKELLNAYNEIAEAIFSQAKEYDDEDEDDYEDMEEDFDEDDYFDELSFTKDEFHEINITETNLHSFTIKIPANHVDAWEEILEQHVGNKCDRSAKSNGLQFKNFGGLGWGLHLKLKI